MSASKNAPARSLLFVPGDRPERFDKAAATSADLVVVDLEDSVPQDHKSMARDAAAQWLSMNGGTAVRVNGTNTVHYSQDLAALAGVSGLAAVVVPMADDPGALSAAHQRLGDDVDIIALIETANGLLRALDLATTRGVTRLAFGHLDFAADIDSSTAHEALLMARSSIVVASRAADLPSPVDGVTTALDDLSLVRAEADRARALGFGGKLCVHPRQVDEVNAAFSPSIEEIAWAHHIVDAPTQGGALRVDGHMVDLPVILKARAILARARKRT